MAPFTTTPLVVLVMLALGACCAASRRALVDDIERSMLKRLEHWKALHGRVTLQYLTNEEFKVTRNGYNGVQRSEEKLPMATYLSFKYENVEEVPSTMDWRVKGVVTPNSWGTSWGESGYMRIQRDVDAEERLCGLAMQASYPTA
ncbi:hypothetical protein Sjap_000473 [Stephania japonica]|uniref:Peptidase C1A papain C-terminal domain-containing protein n=1 Tax=Stephania japonica TaxID=461633 RepID=A0AAP0PQG5_9MAGN